MKLSNCGQLWPRLQGLTGGSAELNSPEAIDRALAAVGPGELRRLLAAHGGFKGQMVARELAALAQRVSQLAMDVQDIKLSIAELKAQREEQAARPPPALAQYLMQFWAWAFSRLAKEAPAGAFVERVAAWFAENQRLGRLKEYDEQLVKEGLIAAGAVEAAGAPCAFLQV